jgi:hypothetical protein
LRTREAGAAIQRDNTLRNMDCLASLAMMVFRGFPMTKKKPAARERRRRSALKIET